MVGPHPQPADVAEDPAEQAGDPGHDTDDQRVRVGATLDYDFEMDGARLLDALHRGGIANQWDDLDGLPVRMAVECKSIDRDIFETEWADGPPAQHIYQAMTQAMLGGYDGALIAGLVVNYNHDLHMYAVPRDEKLERKILADIGDFWGDHAAPSRCHLGLLVLLDPPGRRLPAVRRGQGP